MLLLFNGAQTAQFALLVYFMLWLIGHACGAFVAADMVAAGLVRYDDDGFRSVLGPEEEDALHAVRALAFAKAMLKAARTITLPTTGQPLQMRVGLHR